MSLKNLFKVADCDRVIAEELERARIPIETLSEPARSDLAYSLIGRLDDITFRRSFMHWAAQGPVPLVTARALYADPVGRTDLWVGGHEGRPRPGDWATCRKGEWYVDSYRIESEVALRLFADALRSDINHITRIEARLRELETALRPFAEAYQTDMDRLAEAGAIIRLGTRDEQDRMVPLSAFKRAHELAIPTKKE